MTTECLARGENEQMNRKHFCGHGFTVAMVAVVVVAAPIHPEMACVRYVILSIA